MSKLHLIGGIDAESALKVFEFLDSCKGNAEIVLSSGGGDPYKALAIMGAMSQFKKVLTVRCYGLCMSAATIILASAPNRYMHKDAWFMVHDGDVDTDASEAEVTATLKQHKRENVQWAEILANHSNADVNQWLKMSRKVTYLSAAECLQLGVVDEVFG